MTTALKGAVKNRKPVVSAAADAEGHVDLASTQKEFELIIDTGFTGFIVLPRKLVPKLDIKFLGYERFALATGKTMDLPVFEGWVKTQNDPMKIEMVFGDEIIGMAMLQMIGSKLIVDFEKNEVELIG